MSSYKHEAYDEPGYLEVTAAYRENLAKAPADWPPARRRFAAYSAALRWAEAQGCLDTKIASHYYLAQFLTGESAAEASSAVGQFLDLEIERHGVISSPVLGSLRLFGRTAMASEHVEPTALLYMTLRAEREGEDVVHARMFARGHMHNPVKVALLVEAAGLGLEASNSEPTVVAARALASNARYAAAEVVLQRLAESGVEIPDRLRSKLEAVTSKVSDGLARTQESDPGEWKERLRAALQKGLREVDPDDTPYFQRVRVKLALHEALKGDVDKDWKLDRLVTLAQEQDDAASWILLCELARHRGDLARTISEGSEAVGLGDCHETANLRLYGGIASRDLPLAERGAKELVANSQEGDRSDPSALQLVVAARCQSGELDFTDDPVAALRDALCNCIARHARRSISSSWT